MTFGTPRSQYRDKTVVEHEATATGMNEWRCWSALREFFPKQKIHCLTTSREFVGKEWFAFLLMTRTIFFRIRVRHSDLISSRFCRYGSECWDVKLKFFDPENGR